MASLSVRKLDKNTYDQLRIRAAKHGISMEEEVRRIIYQAVSSQDKISRVFQKYFGKNNGVNLNLRNTRKPHEPLDLNE